jgi:hypothetical protein
MAGLVPAIHVLAIDHRVQIVRIEMHGKAANPTATQW